MNDVKLFVTDLDGSLLMKDHQTVSARNRSALMELKRRNIPLCACTGRVLCVLPPAVKELGFDYAITSNGASCVDLKTGETIFTAHMPPEVARFAWDRLESTQCMAEWYVNGDILMDRHNHSQWETRLKARWHREYLGRGKGVVVEDIRRDFIDIGARGLEKISVFDCPPDIRERAIDAMQATGEYEISTSLGINFEITHISADKGQALESLCRHLDISVQEAVAFGDASNDRQLMATAGVSVAMGNAIDSLKMIAKHTTLTNEEDGVAAFLEEYVLK